jgi:leader peptidase (prepilin peptidase)/N-methyltransferase
VTLLVFIFTALAGLTFGSFLNVCISRLPRHESIVAPRSRCPHCYTPIRSWDNLPVLSWILLRGRCRDCHQRISIRYPLIEIATGALFLLCLLEFSLTVRALTTAAFCFLLLGLAATDAETMLLPDSLTLTGLVLGTISSSFQGLFGGVPVFAWRPAAVSLLWAASAAALILLIRALYWLIRRREGMGLGDAKLLAMIAAWLGPKQTALVLFLGIVSAAFYGLLLIAVGGARRNERGSRTARIPLGSFLCAGAILAVFDGNAILNWYLGFFR